MNYRTAISQMLGSDFVLYADVMPWYGTPGEVHKADYNMVAPGVMDAQLDNMQACGVGGVRVTYQGSNPQVAPFGHQVTKLLAAKCLQRGMRFMFLMDPWDVKQWAQEKYASPEAAMIATLTSPDVQVILKNPLLYVDKWIMEFNTGVNVALVQAAVPGFQIGSWHKHYTWPNFLKQPDGTEYGWDQVPFVRENALPTMVMPGVFSRFDDGGLLTNKAAVLAGVAAKKPIAALRDRSKSVWGDGPARIIPDNAGKTWLDSVAALKSCINKPKIVSLITWNDWDEGTDHEGRAVQATGIRIQ